MSRENYHQRHARPTLHTTLFPPPSGASPTPAQSATATCLNRTTKQQEPQSSFGGAMGTSRRRQRGLNRRRTPDKFQGLKNSKKSAEQRVVERISPEVGGDSHMGEEEDVSDNIVVHKEPSVYDNLLMRLGSDNKVLSDAYKRRLRREEGESDTEEEEDGPDSFDNTNHDYLNEEIEDESAGEEAGTPEEINRIDNDSSESEETDAEDGRESPDSEEEYQMIASSSVTGHSVSPSSFSSHLGHTLSNEELNEVLEKRRKYNWEVSTADMPNCKWIGTGECLKIPDENSSFESNLKPALFKHWSSTYKESGGHEFHASKERMFFSLFNSYRDVLNCNKKPFYLKGQREDSSSMDAYIMHSLNHIFKTRDLVTKNDSKLSKNQESTKEDLLHNDEKFLDQGFARAKVLILLPLRSIAHRVVRKLIQLTPSSHRVNVEHMARFLDEFGGGVDDDEDPDKVNGPGQKSSKPSDFTALFNGNTDDHFMIGIKFTRKSIKLYNDFYKSDMIVASPLGLITKIGEAEREKEKNVDYLSSIEVLIIDYADVIAMQNWAHVKTVVEQLNRLPSKQLGTDVMRVRQWCLDGNARFYRQSIVLGHYLNPDMNALFNHNFVNYEGKVKLVCEYKGTLSKVLLQVRQVCERFAADSIESADDARLQYFSEKVFPKIKDSIQGGIMLFISSYFEFVRLRSFLKSQNASFCLLGEYTKQSDISRSRLWFFEGTRKILLYTERAHFYHRYKIRGIKNLIIYSLPERKEFYPEIVNLLEGSQEMTCSVLFSRFDHLRLERIVGSASAKRMVTSDKSVFVFC